MGEVCSCYTLFDSKAHFCTVCGKKKPSEKKAADLVQSDREKAATKIQAQYRGRIARQQLERRKVDWSKRKAEEDGMSDIGSKMGGWSSPYKAVARIEKDEIDWEDIQSVESE